MEAIKILRTKYPSVLSEDSIIWLPCDLASIAGSIQSAKELISKTDRLDIIGVCDSGL